MTMFHFTVFQQTLTGQVYLFYASVVQTFTCITLNPLICTLRVSCMHASVTFHTGKRFIDRWLQRMYGIIRMNFKLSSLKYCSLFITGQIIVLFAFIQNKICVALKQIENILFSLFFPYFSFPLDKNHTLLSSWLMVDGHKKNPKTTDKYENWKA